MRRYPLGLPVVRIVIRGAAAVAIAVLLAAPAARAATGTWSGGGTDTLWSDANNWLSGTVPGAMAGTTDADQALFDTGPAGIQFTVTLDTPRNLQFIYFDVSAGSYTIVGASPNQLLLTNLGVVSILSTFTSLNTNIETIDAPLTLEGPSTSTGTFADNAATGAMLDIGGAISNGVTGLATLNVSGVGGITISGQIANGAGPLALIKSTGGYLFLTDAGNSYSGGTQVSGGVLNFVSGALGTGTITGAGGEIQYAAGNTQDISKQFVAGGGGVDTNGNNVNWAGAMTATNWPTTSFFKYGAGTLEISGANSGLSTFGSQAGTALSIYGGTLDLDFTANAGTINSKVPAGRALALIDGTLLLNGNAAMASSQSFSNGSSVGFSGATGGNSEIMLVNNGAGILLTLGSFGVGLGQTYNFALPGNGTDGNPGTGGNADQTTTNGVRTTTLNTAFTGGSSPATIIGGWATVDGATWAVTSNTAGTNNITGLSSYSSTFTAAKDVDAPTGTSAPAAGTYNSWRFNNAGPYTVNPAGNITIASDGILETPGVGLNPVAIDVAGTSDTLISGSGAQLIVHQNNTAGTMTINSLIGSGTFTKAGAGTVLLANPSNSYGSATGSTVATFISGGFDGSGNPIFGDLEVPSDPSFDVTDFYLGTLPTSAAANNIVLTNGILQFASSGTSGNTMTLATNRGIGLNGMGGGIDTGNNTVNYAGAISNTSLNSTANPGNFTKLGSGTLILTGSSTYTGYTAVNIGTLELNYLPLSTSANGTLPLILYSGGTSGPLVLGGGTLLVQGSDIPGVYANQAFAMLTVNAGASAITAMTGSGGGTLAITLNAITRNTGGTVDFTLPGGMLLSNNGIITTTANANFAGGQQTILGGWATVGGFSTWAVANPGGAGSIAGLTAYSSTFAAGADVDAPLGASAPAAATYNSWRFNNAGAYAVNPAGNITIATGGILETSNVGASAVTIGASSSTTNTLTSGNGQDLIVLQGNASGALMTINSPIVNNGGTAIGLTKSGGGTLIVTNAGTYTGPTSVNAGTLTLKGTTLTPLADTAITVTNGATLAFHPGAAGTYSFGSTATAGAGATLALKSGSTLDMADGAVETLDIKQGSTFSGSALTLSGATLNLDLSDAGTTAVDNLVVTGTAAASGVNTFNLTTPTSGSLATGFLTLIAAAAGSTLNAGGYAFANGTSTESAVVGGTSYTLTLSSTATAVDLDISLLGTLALSWTGRNGGTGMANPSWDTTSASTNWSSSPAAPSNYLDGDTVTFGDTNSIAGGKVPNTAGLATLTIQSSGVQPKSVTFTDTGSGSGGVDYSIGNVSGGTVGIGGPTGVTLSGTGGVGGTVIFTGINTFTGPVQINAGQLNAQNSGALGSSSGVTVASGGALVLQGGVSMPLSIPLSLSGAGWTTTPAGALNSASGANTYAGAITLAANTTIGSSSTATGDGLTLGGGIDTNSSGYTLNLTGPGNTTVSGAISDAGGLTVSGTGAVTLSRPNTFAGAVLVSSGQLVLTVSGALGNSSGATVISGAALVLNTGAGSAGTYGNITTPISLSIAGAGLAASPAGVLNSLTGNNSYVGPINVDPGGATINSSSTATGDGLTLSGAIVIPGPSPLTFKGTGATTVSGIISGNGGLAYTGTGTLTLNAAAGNSYGTGSIGTTISSGTVAAANSTTALGAGPVTLSGGRLQLQGLPTNANAIGVHVAADQDGNGAGATDQLPFMLGTSATAGVVPMSNWNDLVITRFTLGNSNAGLNSSSTTPPPAQGTDSSSPIPLSLNTSGGASSGATVSAWSGAFTFTVYEGTFPAANVTATPNATLVNGYLGAINASGRNPSVNNSAAVTIGGIPYASYNAYVYFNSSVPDPSVTSPATGELSITTTDAAGNHSNTSAPFYVASMGQTTTGNPYNATAGTYTFTQAAGGTLGTLTANGTNPDAAVGNYVEFTGLAGGAGGVDNILTTTLAADSSNSSYILGIAAIEIVENGGGGGGMVMTNNVNVTANSTIDVTGTNSATLGNATITSTPTTPTVLSVTGGSTGTGAAYTLTLGTVTLVGGSATFNVVNNGSGSAAGAGTLVLGTISDNGSGYGITLTGGGTLDLAAGSTYSGGTTITNGTVNISGDTALGTLPTNPATNVTFNGNVGTPTLQFNAAYSGTSLSTNRGIVVNSGDIGYVDTDGNPIITYAGLITVGSSGTFGKTGVGTFELDAPPTLGNGSALAVTGGTLRLAYGKPAIIDTNVSASVSSGGILELAGAIPQLNQAVNIDNAGTLFVSSSVGQTVGTIIGGTQASPSGGTVVNAGGSLTAYQIVQNSLTIHGTGTTAGNAGSVTLLPSGTGSTTNPTGPNNINFSSTLTSLSIDNNGAALGSRVYYGTLDIGNNGLVIAYGSGTDPYANIDNMIETGFDSAHWDGQGITSSLGRAAAESHTPLNIGLLDFTPGTGIYSQTTFLVFEGQTVKTNAILIRLTYMDDINMYGDMSAQHAASDALTFAANYGSGTTWSVGDLTHQGLVGSAAALLFASNYATGLASLDGSSGGDVVLGGSTAAVPEPASLLLTALGASCLALVARRRRKSRQPVE